MLKRSPRAYATWAVFVLGYTIVEGICILNLENWLE